MKGGFQTGRKLWSGSSWKRHEKSVLTPSNPFGVQIMSWAASAPEKCTDRGTKSAS